MSVSISETIRSALANADGYDPAETRISITPGLADWMLDQRVSLAFTSYQTGQLILAGVAPNNRVAFDEQNYARATGLCYSGGSLRIASLFQIWQLENMLQAGQYANGANDAVFVPRMGRTTNYVDAHEIGVDASGQTVFVNTRYSCLAIPDDRFSFRPVWKPSFISALMPEDRCHLNGLAMLDGQAAYVSAVARSDTAQGWREDRRTGGIIIDVASGEILTDRLSMPHSPRVHDGQLWALDSGKGMIVRVDPATGALDDVCFCPGFLRGLAFHNNHAIVTVSRAREGRFKELMIGARLEADKADAQCGVLIVDLRSGRIIHSILFDGRITEMFDICVIPDYRNPVTLGPATVEMIGAVAFDPGVADRLS